MLRSFLLPKLVNRVFHVTSADGCQGILSSGAIKNNKNENFNLTFPQSKSSYGRKKGYICLFDLRNTNDYQIDDALIHYYFLNPHFTKANPHFLFIDQELYPQLINWREAKEEIGHYGMWVPHIECWYPKDIIVDYITEIFAAKVEGRPSEEIFIKNGLSY